MKSFLKAGIAITSLILATMFCNAQDLTQFKANDGKYGFKDSKEKIIIPATYDEVDDFFHGFSKVGIKSKYGIIDSTGKVIIPIKYDAIDLSTSLHLLVASLNGKSALLLINGSPISPFIYSRIIILEKANAAIVVSSNKYGIVNFGKGVPKYEITFPVKYDEITYKGENLFSFKLGGKYGLVDSYGAELLPCKYDYISSFANGKATISDSNGDHTIDTQGHIQ